MHTAGVFLSIRGDFIANMSNISINMIGEKPDDALQCSTDLYQFLNDNQSLMDVGQWYFPNKSIITETSGDIYIRREEGVVGLYRRNDTLMPTGMFLCQIPDFTQTSQNLYINLMAHNYENKPNTTVTSEPVTSEPDTSGIIVGAVASGVVLLLVLVGILFLILLLKR